MTGYRQAIIDGASVVVKVDGDGQMDPTLLPQFVAPILRGEADYTKGNRFWDLRQIKQMPPLRRIGNLGLSFMSKASTGYWDLFDPTNGYTAISTSVASHLPMDQISRRYFFETDILFRLNTMRAVVVDIPMDARYGDEESGLKVGKILGEFAFKHARNTFKRIGYNYFLRDLSLASFELVAALGLLLLAATFGGWHWALGPRRCVHPTGHGDDLHGGRCFRPAVPAGLPGYDIASVPRRPLTALLVPRRPD